MQSEVTGYQNIRVRRQRGRKTSHSRQASRKPKKNSVHPGHEVQQGTNQSHTVLSMMKGESEDRMHQAAGRQEKSTTSSKNLNHEKSLETSQKVFSTSSAASPKQQRSKSKNICILKIVAFALFLTLLIVALVGIPVAVVYSLPSSTVRTSIEPGSLSRTITFDDIGSNAIWFGGIGYGGVPPGYAGFVWTFTNYINVTQNTLFGASLKSGTFVAYNDNTNASNKLKVTTNNSALFYIRSMTVASVIPAQTPFIIWGIRSDTIIHSMSITITAASASELQFSTWEEAVDTIEMFAYNNTFSFDDLVMSGPF